MSIESYRAGYEAGKGDSVPERFLAATLGVVHDNDYNKGYADAAAGRDFDYYGETE